MSSATRCPILGMFTHHIHKILDNVALLQMRTEYGHLQIDLGLVTQPLLRHSLKQSRNEPRFLAELARTIIHGRIRGISTIMGRAAGPVVPWISFAACDAASIAALSSLSCPSRLSEFRLRELNAIKYS